MLFKQQSQQGDDSGLGFSARSTSTIEDGIALRLRIHSGRLDRCQDDLGALGPEQIIEGPAEFGVPIAQQELDSSSLLAEFQQQVPGLLGDPGAVGIGGHAGKVDAAGVQFDEEQHVQPFEPHGVDGEEVAMIPAACWRRNDRHVVVVRRGAGSRP